MSERVRVRVRTLGEHISAVRRRSSCFDAEDGGGKKRASTFSFFFAVCRVFSAFSVAKMTMVFMLMYVRA